MTLGAIVCTAIAWFIGLLIKVNWTPGLSLDVLLPILTMGGFILSALKVKRAPESRPYSDVR
jgi:hypothetical protein